jgi:hypothetical protein
MMESRKVELVREVNEALGVDVKSLMPSLSKTLSAAEAGVGPLERGTVSRCSRPTRRMPTESRTTRLASAYLGSLLI